jgi:chromosome segregation ATPase
MNLKLTRSRKEVEKQLQVMEKQMKENNLKLLTTAGLLKTKEEETASLKAKLALYNNKEGIKQKIDELSGQLMEKDTLVAIAFEEIKAKDKMINDAVQTVNKISEERRITFEQAQKLKAQIDNNESVKMGTENNLQHVIIKKNQEIEQIKMENHRLAEMIFGHERMKTTLEE